MKDALYNELTEKMLAGKASPEERQAFAEALRGDRARQRDWAEQVELHFFMKSHPDWLAGKQPARRAGFPFLRAAAAAALLLGAGFGIAAALSSSSGRSQAAAKAAEEEVQTQPSEVVQPLILAAQPAQPAVPTNRAAALPAADKQKEEGSMNIKTSMVVAAVSAVAAAASVSAPVVANASASATGTLSPAYGFVDTRSDFGETSEGDRFVDTRSSFYSLSDGRDTWKISTLPLPGTVYSFR